MKKALVLAAVSEAATGVALLIAPSRVGYLLLGEDLRGIAVPVARVAGIVLIAFGVACWPGTPLVGMVIYSAAVALYLIGRSLSPDQPQGLASVVNERARISDIGEFLAAADVFGLQEAYRRGDWMDAHSSSPGGDDS